MEADLMGREELLKNAVETVAEKEQTLSARDKDIANLQEESTSVIDQLKVSAPPLSMPLCSQSHPPTDSSRDH